jgi:uncharacterized protein (TIGR02145 family)
MKRIFVVLLLLAQVLFVFAQKKPLETGTFRDLRDGKTYNTIKIGDQVWMSQNLDYKSENSYCFGDDPNNCVKYGRLYEWNEAKKECPEGWHLPADSEWVKLTDFVGGTATAGHKLNIYGPYGFKGLYAGRRVSYGQYFYLGSVGIFWTSTDASTDNAKTMTIAPGNPAVVPNNYPKYNAYSVRCIKNF